MESVRRIILKKRHVVILVVATLLLSVMLTGCSEYSSHFKAIALVHSNKPSSAFMNFYEFSGTMVFKLKSKDADGGVLRYTANIESGSIRVYCDTEGSKDLLVSIEPWSNALEGSVSVPQGKIYIIVESNGKSSNGALTFKIEE